ncbi:hypothetical protein NLJ89_g5396 [Agrocybe chaxingu]|uniref:Uncharacterized protein n=1 Tax=Agrocybe chaxingu TaxID=84603 RepID=A0A9W8MVM5_9AGAR|nr:hypothetical protein NLJ89_g5396 [Agrocybe chaxingu]
MDPLLDILNTAHFCDGCGTRLTVQFSTKGMPRVNLMFMPPLRNSICPPTAETASSADLGWCNTGTPLCLNGHSSIQPQISQELEPLDPAFSRGLESLLDEDPTPAFLACENQSRWDAQAASQREKQLEYEEERQYQAAVAASLGHPASTDAPRIVVPTALASTLRPTPNTTASASTSAPDPTPSSSAGSAIRTVPYRPPNMKKHLNSDWMRPYEDRTGVSKPVKSDPNRRFRVVLWGKSNEAPIVLAVDKCPQWPTWVV